ncbi:MAG: malonyl-CoA synthase [Pseudomonadota bacterium]
MSNHLYDCLFADKLDADRTVLSQPGRPDVTRADLVARAAQFAHALTGLGMTPGDRVMVQADKSTDVVAIYLATVQAGGVFLPLNTAYTGAELAHFLQDAEPRIVVCDAGREAVFADLCDGGTAVMTVGPHGGGSFGALADAQSQTFAACPRGPEDLAALLYTSGTTGRSKGAMLTHANLASNAETLVGLWQITARDRLIHALPIYHTHGLFVALNTALIAAAEVVFLPRFDADAILDAMPDATMMMGVPTFYTRLLADPRLTRDRAAGMRLFISGSAPLLAETHIAFEERTGHRVLERYGMTETNMTTSNPYDGARRAGTVGLPLPGVEVRVTDPDTGAPLAQGDIGMVEVRGPNVFSGYWRLPEKTREEFRADGFFITGDLGTLGPDGYLTIVGRSKDLIITGGLNVYPKEVEDVLNQIEGVAESAVFGVPDPDFGERIIAAIVMEAGSALDADAVTRALGQGLARFKHPRQIEVLPELPRNAMGKVQKVALRATYGENP